MDSLSKAMATAKIAMKHKTVAKFSPEDYPEAVEQNTQFSAQSDAFYAYADHVKTLRTHLGDFKKAALENWGSAGAASQALVDLCTEVEEGGGGGEAATKALKIRSTVARVQANLHRKVIPELDNVLLAELDSQAVVFKDIKAKLNKRLETVAEANYYQAKFKQLEELERTGGDKAPDTVKMQRNREKHQVAKQQLEAETTALLDSMAKVELERRALATERCEWLRGVLRLFYQEASQAHLNASSGVSNSGSAMQPSLEAATSSEFGGGGEGGVGGEDQLLDLGHHQMSVAERAAGMSSNLSNMGASFGMGLRHAAKHKGGIGSVFLMKKTGGGGAGAQAGAAGDGGVGGGVATEQDTGASDYDVSVAKFKRKSKQLTSVKSAIISYLDSTQKFTGAVAKVASDLAALSPHECVAPPLFRFTWAEGANQLLQDLCNTFMTESIDPLTMHIATSEQVDAAAEKRHQCSPDVAYYATKMPALKEKAEKLKLTAPGEPAALTAEDRAARNSEKQQKAVQGLEESTSAVVSLLSSLGAARSEVIDSLLSSYDFRQQSAFAAVAVDLTKTANDVDLTAPIPPPVVTSMKSASGSSSGGGFGRSMMRRGSTGMSAFGDSKAGAVPVVHAQGNEDILTALDANDSDDDDDKNGAPPNKDPRASVPIRTGMDASTDLPVQQPPPPPQPMAHAASQPPPPYGNPPASNGANPFAPPPPPPPSSNNPFAVGGHDAAALANAAGAENNFAPPPPPPPPPVVADKVKVVALFDFPGVEDSDLPFSEGDQFEASASEFAEQEAEGGWVKGWNRGREGVFPSNYVKRA